MKMNSYTPSCYHSPIYILSLCVTLIFSYLPNLSANDTVIQVEQKINEALDAAGNDPVAVEAALLKELAEARPTSAGMKVIASAAMRKFASYNKKEIITAVSEGMIRAAMNQAMQSGIDPIQAAAAVSEGLLSSAMGTASRRGGNSISTGSSVAKSIMKAVVETAAKLKLSVSNAANAAAFGAIKAAVATSADYGHDLISTTFNITSGITHGAVSAAIAGGLDTEGIALAVKTGSVDGVHVQAREEKLQNTQMVRAAVLGFERGLGLALGRQVSTLPEEDVINRDILSFGEKEDLRIEAFVDSATNNVVLVIKNLDKLPVEAALENLILTLEQNGREIFNSASTNQTNNFTIKEVSINGTPSLLFDLGEPISQETTGLYALSVKEEGNTEIFSTLPVPVTLVISDNQEIVISPAE
jgi:hypothetical protein